MLESAVALICSITARKFAIYVAPLSPYPDVCFTWNRNRHD
jgi:hypothetical protein